jgi:hypothetical protein
MPLAATLTVIASNLARRAALHPEKPRRTVEHQ